MTALGATPRSPTERTPERAYHQRDDCDCQAEPEPAWVSRDGDEPKNIKVDALRWLEAGHDGFPSRAHSESENAGARVPTIHIARTHGRQAAA